MKYIKFYKTYLCTKREFMYFFYTYKVARAMLVTSRMGNLPPTAHWMCAQFPIGLGCCSQWSWPGESPWN